MQPTRIPVRQWALAAVAATTLACAVAPSASAGAADRSVDPSTLTPAPPDFFNAACATAGGQIICTLAFVDPVSPVLESTGVMCGTGADEFEVLDTWTRSVEGRRFYSADGLLLRRHFNDRWQGSFTNSVTGKSVAYSRRNTYLHDLAVPGDVQSGVERDTVTFRVSTTKGAIVFEAGRVVLARADDATLFEAGRHLFSDYFGGDSSAIDPLCAALS